MDRDLVERARSGDQHAFADQVHQGSDTLFGVARRILRDPGLAEDVPQNALVTIWRKLPHLREADHFDAWAFRILATPATRMRKATGDGRARCARPSGRISVCRPLRRLGGATQVDPHDDERLDARKIPPAT